MSKMQRIQSLRRYNEVVKQVFTPEDLPVFVEGDTVEESLFIPEQLEVKKNASEEEGKDPELTELEKELVKEFLKDLRAA